MKFRQLSNFQFKKSKMHQLHPTNLESRWIEWSTNSPPIVSPRIELNSATTSPKPTQLLEFSKLLLQLLPLFLQLLPACREERRGMEKFGGENACSEKGVHM